MCAVREEHKWLIIFHARFSYEFCHPSSSWCGLLRFSFRLPDLNHTSTHTGTQSCQIAFCVPKFSRDDLVSSPDEKSMPVSRSGAFRFRWYGWQIVKRRKAHRGRGHGIWSLHPAEIRSATRPSLIEFRFTAPTVDPGRDSTVHRRAFVITLDQKSK